MPMEARNQSNQAATVVLSIECLKGSSKADEWTSDMLQTGDVVEDIKIGSGSGSLQFKAPFKGGRSWVQKVLHNSFKTKETSISVRVRRGSDEFADLQACIVPNEAAGKKQYMLRSIEDPNYIVDFTNRKESECRELQASRTSRMVNALTRSKLQDGYVSYPWDRRMQEMLCIPSSGSFLSMLLLPKASNREASRYNDLEDTLARANAWLNASQASGVPIVFVNVQTESLLTKISGETASSTVNASSLSDLSNLAHESLYGFEDYHGVDIGVVRAVRLWYAPMGGEPVITMKLKDDDDKLGFAISRTEEGFIFISSVMEGNVDTPATRSGLRSLYEEATSASRLLVVSRLANQKVLPWMVSSTGAIRCYDTVSLSQKLSLHRHTKVPIVLHFLMWPSVTSDFSRREAPASACPPPKQLLPTRAPRVRVGTETQIMPLPLPLPVEMDSWSTAIENSPEVQGAETRGIERDTAGEISFRFHDFHLSDNWV